MRVSFARTGRDPEAHLVALDGAAVVGMTQLWASQATDALLYTGFTGVAQSRTGNEESNPMLGINLRLGFVPRPAFLILALARRPGS